MIDAHVHLWDTESKQHPRAESKQDYPPAHFTAQDFFSHARPAGVNRAVLIQMSFYEFDNTYLLDAIRQHPGVFSGVGIVDSSKPHPESDMAKLAQQGVRGFRIVPHGASEHWLETPGMQAMWRYGGERRLAMCPLINPGELSLVGRMCTSYPDTPVVIDHLARIGADGQIRDSDVRLLCGLSKHKNVKVKVSAFYALGRKHPPYRDLAPFIRRVFEDYGPRRLMWASDSPFQVQPPHTYKASIGLVQNGLPFLGPEDKLWLLEKTAGAAFFEPV